MIKSAAPFSVFMNLSTNSLGFRYQPFEVRLDGINSKISIPNIFELGLTPMTNLVIG